jgi:hypothetical protein
LKFQTIIPVKNLCITSYFYMRPDGPICVFPAHFIQLTYPKVTILFLSSISFLGNIYVNTSFSTSAPPSE